MERNPFRAFSLISLLLVHSWFWFGYAGSGDQYIGRASKCDVSPHREGEREEYGYHCYCDQKCAFFNDCCYDNRTLNDSTRTEVPESFCCLTTAITGNSTKPTWSNYYKMIGNCPSKWIGSPDVATTSTSRRVNELCEETPTISEPPVTDKETGIVYRNKYCGLCNNVTIDQLLQWSSQWSCDEGFERLLNSSTVINGTVLNTYCVPITYKPPKLQESPQLPIRRCWPLVPTPNTTHNIMDYKALVANCTQCGASSHPTNTSDMYWNSNCEQGNGETNNIIIPNCDMDGHMGDVNDTAGRITVIISKLTPARLLLTSSNMRGYTNEITQVVCDENYVFNVITNTCIMPTYLSPHNSDDCIDCQLLNRTDYTFVDSITVQSHKDNMTHSILMFGTDGTVLICNCNNVIDGFIPLSLYPISLFVISITGFLLDIMAGAILLVTYSIFKQLRTFYGKLLMHMSAVVIAGDIAFVLTLPVERFREGATCEALAILSHFILLLRFASMSVLAFEVLKHFYEALKLKRDSDDKTWRSLLLYILPQYVVPLVIVGVCVILNYISDGVVEYGRDISGSCWIAVPTAAFISFVLPSGIMIMFNMFVFIFCLVVTIKMWKSPSKFESYGQTPKQLLWRNFRILFAIFSTSGVTWTLTIVVLFDKTIDDTTLWLHYIFVLFNTIQLVFVALAYICTKRVAKLYKGFFTRLYTKSKICTKRFQTKANEEPPATVSSSGLQQPA